MSQVTKNNLIYLKDKNDNWSSKWRMFASKKLNEMLLKCRVCKQSSSNSRHSFLIVTIPRLFCFNVTLDTENGKISQLILTPNFSGIFN
ncbi:hypothetical protein GJ496_006150 [Pomphorhynchus laevis]|nr:hypothetical protein GJ496_006150 [Pomphorhynchus laevis]